MLAVTDTLTSSYQGSVRVSLPGTPAVRTLLRGRPHGYTVKRAAATDELDFLIRTRAHRTYDLFASFFNPTPVIYAWMNGMPSIFHDGLLDFWELKGFAGRLEGDLRFLSQCRERRDYRALRVWHDRLWEKNPHEIIFLAHFLATKSYVRYTHLTNEVIGTVPSLAKRRIAYVGSVLSPDIIHAKRVPREHVLVTLGGSLAPVITHDENLRYLRSILSFVAEASATPAGSRYPWIVLVNRTLLQSGKLGRLPNAKNLTVRQSANTREFTNLLSRSVLILTQPGYGTVQEAAYLRTPTFFLPEQNAGQPPYVKEAWVAGYPVSFGLTLMQPGVSECSYGEFEIKRMYGDIEKLLKVSNTRRNEKRKLLETLLTDAEMRSKVADIQHSALGSMTGGYMGAETMAKGIYQLLNGSSASVSDGGIPLHVFEDEVADES